MTDPDKLLEKYLHSMAERLVDEGDLEEGIVYFQKAIDVGDTPHAWSGLSRALGMAGDTAGAVGAISRAIKMAPGIPDYYYERSRLLTELGREDLARDDLARAIVIDPNYARMNTISRAVSVLNEAFEGVFDKPSCPVRSCPAYCCHFKERMFLHGVTIGAWKLSALREYFREKGLNEKDLLGAFPVAGAENTDSLFSPHDIIRYEGAASVIFPRRKEQELGEGLARDIPKGRHYLSLMWIDGTAHPCCFLESGRCAIYDAGGEPSLDSCASFLCMTGFVFMVLSHLGMLDERWFAGKSMADLNQAAVEALIILGDVYGNEELQASDPADDTLKNTLLAAAREKICQLFEETPARP